MGLRIPHIKGSQGYRVAQLDADLPLGVIDIARARASRCVRSTLRTSGAAAGKEARSEPRCTRTPRKEGTPPGAGRRRGAGEPL